jgi:hypothetical protein
MSKFTSKFAQFLGVARVRQSEIDARAALSGELLRQLTEGEPVEVKFARRSVPVVDPDAEGWMGKPHPVSKQDATSFARGTVGLWKLRTVINQRNDWWNKLRAARTPEERLTCERMINALSEAIGLHQPELGAQLFQDNPYSATGRTSTEDEIAERERREVDKWR